MTELDEKVADVLTGMPTLPADVGRDVISRLERIEKAIRDDMMEEGTILVQFKDLSDEVVVLSLTVKRHFAFLDISTSEDAIALSDGYSFCIGENGVTLSTDHWHRLSPVDHAALSRSWHETERTLLMLREAESLVKDHPVFSQKQSRS